MNHERSTLDTQQTPPDHGDPVDQHIAGALRGRVPAPATDLDVVHRHVLEQSGRIRRRRTSVMAVGTTAVLVVGAWAALSTRGGEPSVRLAEPELTTAPTITATTLPATTTPATTATTVAQTAITTGNTVTTVDGSDDDPAVTTANTVTTNTVTTNTTGNTVTTNTTGNTVTTNTLTTNPVTTIDDSGNDSDDDGPTVTTGNTTGTTTVSTIGSSTTVVAGPAPFTQSYDSAGGSITVSWNGTSLSLLGTNPQSGYTAEVEDVRSDRVKVRFRSEAGGDSRIEVRIEGSQTTVDID